MDADALVDRLEAEGTHLLDAAAAAGWDARIPGLDWDVRGLVAHTGGVHRWATAVVTCRPADEVGAAEAAVGDVPAPDAELGAWFAAGLAGLVAALRDAPADLEVPTFLPADSPRHFWARRQAHETAIHRVDAQSALGPVADCDVDFAQDGLAELVEGFAARRRNAIPRAGTLALLPTDAGSPWLLRFGGEKTAATRGGGTDGADAVVTGTSAGIYRWAWNRPADVTITGDAALPRLWSETVRVQWR